MLSNHPREYGPSFIGGGNEPFSIHRFKVDREIFNCGSRSFALTMVEDGEGEGMIEYLCVGRLIDTQRTRLRKARLLASENSLLAGKSLLADYLSNVLFY